MTSETEAATVTSPEVHLNQEEGDTGTPVRRILRPLTWNKRTEQLTLENPIAGSPLSPRVWAPAFSYAMATARTNNSGSSNEPVYRNPNDATVTSSPSSTPEPAASSSSSSMPLVPVNIPDAVASNSQIAHILEKLRRSDSFQAIISQPREVRVGDSDIMDRMLILVQEIQQDEKDLPKLKSHLTTLRGQIMKMNEDLNKKTKASNAISSTICDVERKSEPKRKELHDLVRELGRARCLVTDSPVPAAPLPLVPISNGTASSDGHSCLPVSCQSTSSRSSTLALTAATSSVMSALPPNAPSAKDHAAFVPQKRTAASGKRPLLTAGPSHSGRKVKRLCNQQAVTTAPKTTSGVRGAQPMRATMKKKTAPPVIPAAAAAPVQPAGPSVVRVKREKPDDGPVTTGQPVSGPERVVVEPDTPDQTAPHEDDEFVINVLNDHTGGDEGHESDHSDSDIFAVYTNAGSLDQAANAATGEEEEDEDVVWDEFDDSVRRRGRDAEADRLKREEEEALRKAQHYVPPDPVLDDDMGLIELNPDLLDAELMEEQDEVTNNANTVGGGVSDPQHPRPVPQVESCTISAAASDIPSVTSEPAAAVSIHEPSTAAGVMSGEHPLADIRIKKEKE